MPRDKVYIDKTLGDNDSVVPTTIPMDEHLPDEEIAADFRGRIIYVVHGEAESVEEKRIDFTLEDLIEKYKDVKLLDASSRFKNEFFTGAMEHGLKNFARDQSLRFFVEEDKKIPTAAIDTQTGMVMIGKSLMLKCLDGEKEKDRVFNFELLKFIFAHEVSHYIDLYNPEAASARSLSGEIRGLDVWNDELNKRIHGKWKEFFPEDEEISMDEGTPIHSLYFRFMNCLDDCSVNFKATNFSQQIKLPVIAEIYRDFLFVAKNDSVNKAPMCMQLGEYLLQKVMNPNLEIAVDPAVQAELDVEYDFNGEKMTLLKILQYLAYRHKNMHASVRYSKYYLNANERFFIPAFERLMKIDKENSEERLKEAGEKAQEDNDKQGYGDGEGEPGEGEGGGYANPFAKRKKSIEDAKGKIDDNAEKESKRKKDDAKEAMKTDDERKAENAQQRNAAYAGKYGVDLDKATKYFEMLKELREDIEKLADVFIYLLLQNNEIEIEEYDESRRKAGIFDVNTFLSNFAGIYGGEKGATDVFSVTRYLEKLKDKTYDLTLRLLIDNSGSMSAFIDDLDKFFILLNNALRCAEEKLLKKYGIRSNLNTEMLIFGNEPDSEGNGGGRVIKAKDAFRKSDDEFHKSMIESAGKITCTEGTHDWPAWAKINDELFKPEEVKSSENSEAISLAYEITDGATFSPEKTAPIVEDILSKGIGAYCLFLDNPQAIDESVEDRTKYLHDEFHRARSDREREEIMSRIAEERERYSEENEELRTKSESSFWEEGRFLRVSKPFQFMNVIVTTLYEEIKKRRRKNS